MAATPISPVTSAAHMSTTAVRASMPTTKFVATNDSAASKPLTVTARSSPAVAKLRTPAYAVFLHRSELKRKRLHRFKASQTKINLTNHLISKQEQRMDTCSYEDIKSMVREMGFRTFLHREVIQRHVQLKAMQKKSLQKKVMQKKVPKLKRLQ